MKLIIANKNYSSWSLRGWMALKAFNIPFEEIKLSLSTEAFYKELAQYTPIGKVPVLLDGDLSIWDSLAICEYINETYLDGKGWPADKHLRARARSIVADMHSGFFGIRNEMPMNCRAKRRVELSDQAKKEVDTLDRVWTELRQHTPNGPYLFGEFSLADAFFAPVIFRFKTYGIELSDAAARDYQQTMLAHPAMKSWLEDSVIETDIVEAGEAGKPV